MQKEGVEREKKILKEFQSQYNKKDQELKTSRDQVSQLLRICEQLTQSNKKFFPLDSKSSDSNSTNKILIKEQLEISSQSLTDKLDDKDTDGEIYYIKDGNYGKIRLKELNCESFKSEEKSGNLGPSPTLSNISEGITGIFVDEVKRKFIKSNETLFDFSQDFISQQ